MKSEERSQLQQVLRGRRDAIADRWYQAIAPTSFVPHNAAEVRRRLVEWTADVITLLFAEPFERGRAEAIGASLARLHYVDPEALSQTQEVLAQQIVEGLPAEEVVALQPRLVELLGGVAAGFLRQAHETTLAEQERIRGALVTALRQTREALQKSRDELEQQVEERTAELTAANEQLKHEIIERKRAEEALRESEARYRAIIEDQTELICRFQPDGTLTFVNEAYCRYFGRKREELIGESCKSLIPEEDWEFVQEQSTALSLENPTVTYEHRVVAADGEIRWQQWTDRAIFDEQGCIIEYQSVGRDITERKRAGQEIRQRNRELAALNTVATTMMQSALDLDEVLQRITDGVVEGLGCNTAVMLLLDEEEEVFRGGAVATRGKILERINAVIGFPLRRIQFPARSDFNEAVSNGLEGRITIKHDLHELVNPVLSKGVCSALQRLLGSKTFLSLPLLARGKVVGGIFASTREEETSEGYKETIMTFANQAAIAIENARLFEEEKRRATQLALINEVGEKVVSILDLDRLMQEVTRSIQESFDYYNVAFFLLDEERGEVVMQAVAGGFEHLAAGEYRQPLDEGIIGFTVRTGESRLANDISKDPYYVKGFLDEVLTQSELCVPIKLGDRIIGALDVQSTRLNAFDPADVVALEALADRIAIAIENARLYEETQRHSERLAQTLAVSELLHRDLGLEQLLEHIAHGTVGLGFRRAVINVCQPGEEDSVIAQAMAGLDEPEREALMDATYRWSDFQALMQERFQVSRSYLIRHEEVDWERDFRGVVVTPSGEDRGPGYWHPEDMLLVPLWGSRGQPVGLLSADEPVDGLLPDLNTIQTLEAFANQAAIAIENARLFEEIEERRLYLAGVLRDAPDAIVTLDAQHRIVEWNAGAERLFGYSREETLGRNLDDLVTGPDVYDEAVGFTQMALGGMEVPPTETVRYRKDGSPVNVIVAGSPIMAGEELLGIVAVYTDITERVRMEETLRALALLDELTGLYNRRGFFTLAEQQLKTAKRAETRMVLLFADFDGLKWINDTFGHPEGDRALIEVADIFRETFRESDIIARIAGDEFVVLAIETNGAPAGTLITRLRENLEAHNAEGDRRYELSLSVGVARYDPEHPCSLDDLLARADRAMYERKQINQKSQS